MNSSMMVFLPAFGISCAYQIERELLAITVLGCNSVGAGAGAAVGWWRWRFLSCCPRMPSLLSLTRSFLNTR